METISQKIDTIAGLNRRRIVQGLSFAALPLGAYQSAEAAIAGNNNMASWAISSDANIYAQAFARRFSNVLINALDPAAFSGVGAIYRPDRGSSARFTIMASQGKQNVLGIPGVSTTIWGFHNQETGPTFPGRSFEVRQGTPVTVRWGNNLRTAAGPLPHIFPVDQTISIQTPSTGVPLAIHHHGSDSASAYDGTPDQWATPHRQEIGPGLAADNSLGQLALDQPVVNALYDNTQEASLHWYHDHAESITRINVGAGLAGLYVVRDTNEDQLCSSKTIPSASFEIAVVLQDRTFDAAGNLTYSADPVDYPGPLSANFPRNNPTHMPEKFGDVICVNGQAWPVMNIQARSYRLRLLNGSDSRFYTLNFGARTGVYQIGTDLGLLNRGVKITAVTVAPGERVDLVLDFSAYAGWLSWLFQPNVNVDVTNSAATPFPGGTAPQGGAALVMRFAVNQAKNLWAPDISASLLPYRNLRVQVPQLPSLPTASKTVRRILLAEGVDQYGRITPLLGTYDPKDKKGSKGNLGTLSLHDPITETPKLGSTEVWEFWNASVDAHPVHMHLVQFQILNRQNFSGTLAAKIMGNGWEGARLQAGANLVGAAASPALEERGLKDTVVCPPGQVTRVVVRFDRPGKFVYHCHILSHEEHDMMRFYEVV